MLYCLLSHPVLLVDLLDVLFVKSPSSSCGFTWFLARHHLRDTQVAVTPARLSVHILLLLTSRWSVKTGVIHGRYHWLWGCMRKLELLSPRTSLCFRTQLIRLTVSAICSFYL